MKHGSSQTAKAAEQWRRAAAFLAILPHQLLPFPEFVTGAVLRLNGIHALHKNFKISPVNSCDGLNPAIARNSSKQERKMLSDCASQICHGIVTQDQARLQYQVSQKVLSVLYYFFSSITK